MVTVEIAYTEQRENHGTMVLHGVSYSAYTLRYGSYCKYVIVPSSQCSLTFSGLLYNVCLGWYLRPLCFPFKVMLLKQYALYMIFSRRLSTFPLARVYHHTSALSSEILLTCYGRRARLSPRAMAPFTSNKNSSLVNPR